MAAGPWGQGRKLGPLGSGGGGGRAGVTSISPRAKRSGWPRGTCWPGNGLQLRAGAWPVHCADLSVAGSRLLAHPRKASPDRPQDAPGSWAPRSHHLPQPAWRKRRQRRSGWEQEALGQCCSAAAATPFHSSAPASCPFPCVGGRCPPGALIVWTP